MKLKFPFMPPVVLEVMQFARDAHNAEGWMIHQEPYLRTEADGVGVSSFVTPCYFLCSFSNVCKV